MRRTTLFDVRVLAAPVALAALLLAAPRAEATCGSTACFLTTRTQDGALTRGTFRFDLSYRYVDQSRKRFEGSSTDEVLTPGVNFAEGVIEPDHHREIRTGFHVLQADASYGLTSRLSLLASVPLVSAKHHEHVVIEDGEEHFTDGDGTTGFGDLQIGARYAFLPARSDLVLVTGWLKLPTGAHDKLDTSGEITEPSLQPGTGSTDLTGGLQYSHQLGTPGSEVFLAAGYRHNGTSDLDYHLGDETQAGIGYGRRFGMRWTGNLQLNLRHGARDRYSSDGVPSTGSTLLNISPGLRWQMTSLLDAYVFLPLPLLQHVNEAQLAPKIGVVAGFSRRF